MQKRYVVRLSAEERERLRGVLSRKRGSRFSRTRAWIYLKADEGPDGPGWTDARIAEAFDVSPRNVSRAREQLVEEGLEASLEKKSQPRPEQRRLDGAKEARLIALACGPSPEGIRSLDTQAACRPHGGVGGRTGGTLVRNGAKDVKKNQLKPHRKEYWCIPPKASVEFVFCMENVLDVYHRPHDPRFPVVCMDETSKQLVREVRPALAPEPGRAERP